jgi:hypothetical protein
VNHEHIERVLHDFATLRDVRADSELEAVKTALMLEDVFGIRLSDADIGPALLDDSTVRALVDRNIGAC